MFWRFTTCSLGEGEGGALWSWPILQCDMPTHNFHAILFFLPLCFIILCFRPKFSVVSVSIFIGFWLGEETFVSAFEIYDSNDHERAGMGSTVRVRIVVKIIASVCEPNETKRKLRERNNNNNNMNWMVCKCMCVCRKCLLSGLFEQRHRKDVRKV